MIVRDSRILYWNTPMSLIYYEERIQRALRSTAPGLLQARLAAVPDRNLAIAVKGLGEEDRMKILSIIPPAKRLRVDQELEYTARLKITSGQIRGMAEALAGALEGDSGPARGTWIAPGRNKTAR
jgi:hypothetical protein